MVNKIVLIEIPEEEYDAYVALYVEVMKKTTLPVPSHWPNQIRLATLAADMASISEKCVALSRLRQQTRDDNGIILPRKRSK